MSFQFTIGEQSFNRDERLWTVYKIKRLYDVSAVDIPAYDDTSISARKQELDNINIETAKNELLLKLKLI